MVSSVRTRTKSAPPRAEGRTLDYEVIAVELLRALRGPRSRAELSRRLGYRSNVVHRWETRRSWPTAARFLQIHRRLSARGASCFELFFRRAPTWLDEHAPESPEGVAAFLRELRGKTSIAALAVQSGFSRYQVSRWLAAVTQPSLPEFLCLVEASSRRVLDLIALIADPARLPSIASRWRLLESVRAAGYQKPWSHAVLRALEIEPQPSTSVAQIAELCVRLGVDRDTIMDSLDTLRATGQVTKRRGRFAPQTKAAVNTSRDPELARSLKTAWTSTALRRLEQNAPGNFGYSLFAISRDDLRRLRDLHLEYVRAMQELIASSGPSECVGLYCSQLLDLAAEDNVLAHAETSPPRAPFPRVRA